MTADRFPGKIGIRDSLVISCCCRWTTASGTALPKTAGVCKVTATAW